MVVGPKWTNPGVYKAQSELEILAIDVQVLELEAYSGRVRNRNRSVRPPQEGEVSLQLIEPDAEIEIVDSRGYKDGLPCILINDSTLDLDVEIRDPRGHQFKFTIPHSLSLDQKRQEVARLAMVLQQEDIGWEEKLAQLRSFLGRLGQSQKERKLEIGEHRVKSFRQGRDREPWTDGIMKVRSDKTYWPEQDMVVTEISAVLTRMGFLSPKEREKLLESNLHQKLRVYENVIIDLGLTLAEVAELDQIMAEIESPPGYFGYSRFYGRSYGF